MAPAARAAVAGSCCAPQMPLGTWGATMDVSDAVDTLFSGAVPEREGDLRAEWGRAEDRVRLLDRDGFLLQQTYGTIQVNEIALRQIWLTGYAAWRALQAYNVPLLVLAYYDCEFDPVTWNTIPAQAELDAAFDPVFDKVRELSQVQSLGDFEMPPGVPTPAEGLKLTDPQEKAAFDLVCMAGAYVFAHEIRHAIFMAAGDAPDDIIEEERACDAWALGLMLDQAADFEQREHPDLPGWVRAKRILGVVIAQLTILVVTPRNLWDASEDHPPVRERLRAVLDAATEPVPDWFWVSVASMLTAFARRLGTLGEPREFPPSPRDLAYDLCDRLRSA